jgi:hypothetical protein
MNKKSSLPLVSTIRLLVAKMENGDGPVRLIRAYMDGLPVEEKTNLEYASKARLCRARDYAYLVVGG